MSSVILKEKWKVQRARGFDRKFTTSTGLDIILSKPAKLKFDDVLFGSMCKTNVEEKSSFSVSMASQ